MTGATVETSGLSYRTVGGPLVPQTLAPMFYTTTPSSTDTKNQKRSSTYVLLIQANRHTVVVLAYQTGRLLTELSLLQQNTSTTTNISCATTTPGSLWVGYENGTVHQYNWTDAHLCGSSHNDDIMSDSSVATRPILHAIAKSKYAVWQLQVLPNTTTTDHNNCLLYCLVGERSDGNNDQTTNHTKCRLVRYSLDKTQNGNTSTTKKETLDTYKQKKQDQPSFLAVRYIQNQAVAIVGGPATLVVYCRGRRVELKALLPPSGTVMTALHVTDTNSVVLGQSNGFLRILYNLLPLCLQYTTMAAESSSATSKRSPHHPSQTVRLQKVHWHAHPVACLDSFGTNLYSGGEESVLVSWDLKAGHDKPHHALPRLAKGGLQCIVANHESILLYCRDNSLMLIQAFSKIRKWKVQGVTSLCPPTLIRPRFVNGEQLILLSNGSPGQLQFYHPKRPFIEKEVVVAPYNRVSRTETNMAKLPPPKISHIATNGKVLVTVDEVFTENECIGKVTNDSFGSVSTVRFWNEKLENINAMSHPHGKENAVSSLAVSQSHVVTISNDESAFRIWEYANTWYCRAKVTFPSGYSNFGATAVAFSSDATVLGIAFGVHISLWNVQQLSLLTALREMDIVNGLTFLDSEQCHDMILTQTAATVAVHSPYGLKSSHGGWCWEIPAKQRKLSCVCCVEFIPEVEIVAIAQYDSKSDTSRIILVDAVTGVPVDMGESMVPIAKNISGKVLSLVSGKTANRPDAWSDERDAEENYRNHKAPLVCLYAYTSRKELIRLSSQNNEGNSTADQLQNVAETSSTVPDVLLWVDDDSTRNRKRKLLGVGDLAPRASVASDSAPMFMGEDNSAIPSHELPLLCGAFTDAFVGRKLRRTGD